MLYPHRFSLAMACAAGKAPSPWYHGVLHPTFTVVIYLSYTDYEHEEKTLIRYKKFRILRHTQCAMHCTAST